MTPEQLLREDLEAVEHSIGGGGFPEAVSVLAAVGRLLDPIPDEAIEAMAGDWLTVHIRRDLAEKMLNGYRAWLIGGEQ